MRRSFASSNNLACIMSDVVQKQPNTCLMGDIIGSAEHEAEPTEFVQFEDPSAL
jgi:hypothetical protein